MNPLSPLTYHRRHKWSAVLLLALITLATLALYVMVSVLDSIPMRARFHYLTRLSRAYPVAGSSLEPGVVSQIQTHPDVARVVLDNGLSISPPSLIGTDNLRLLGVSQDDAQYLMDHVGVRLKEGRMFEPRTNEIVLSEEVARALGLQVGDRIDRSIDERYYGNVPTPMVLVGILEGDASAGPGPSVRVGLASYEYLDGHELYAPRTTSPVVVALVVGVINRIALTRRLSEFGLLNAVGHHKKRLIGRLTLETAAVAGAGWVAGLAFSWLVLAWLRAGLYYSKGMELDLANLAPFWFVVPIPLVVVAFATLSARGTFARFDAISIIERGKLGMETQAHRRAVKRSSTKPLSSRTFYLRHRRRGVLLVASMALMILGVAFPAFLVSVVTDAFEPSFEYLRYVSEVSPGMGTAVDPGVTAQIRGHPAVARVIPAIPLGLTALVPPGSGTGVSIYGVAEDELPVLMDLFGMHLFEGRLPLARSNEIVLSEAVARNRGLRVGDTVGRSVEDGDEVDPLISDDIPTEMVVVGLLSVDDLWLGFAPFEYLDSHELASSRPVHLLVIPAEGRKRELDTWLQESVASVQTDVNTYGASRLEARRAAQSILLLFAAIESIIAVVAAIALAVLNHIFFSQRRDEFGVLHAVGRSRPWLVLRTVRETGSVVTVAWLIGAAMCVIGLFCAQAAIYAPRGLSLNFTNPAPWLFTLPIPLAVIAVGAGTIARTLSGLDPVAVIERR